MVQPNTGIVLLGGRGVRLYPLTIAVNKHFLPAYNKPLALFAIGFLVKSGIKNVIAVINQEDKSKYQKLLNDGSQFNCHIDYIIQETPLGTAHAVKLCEEKIKSRETFVTLWGDNIFEFTNRESVFSPIDDYLARIHIIKMDDPKNYGVIEIKTGKILSIEEKPSRPKDKFVCTGFMIFNKEVFKRIGKLPKNKKNEWDIMNVLKEYQEEGKLDYRIIKGRWLDAGVSFESLFKTSEFVRNYGVNKNA